MEDYTNYPGPNPSTLETVNHPPKGIIPMTMRVTYTSDSVTDYVNLKNSSDQLILELAEPLLGIVRKAGKINNLKQELTDALTAIGVGSIVSHFKSAVAEYVNSLLPVDAFPETIALTTGAYLLTKMYDADLLMLGHIHQASIDELPSWMELIESAKHDPDIQVS